MNIQIKRGIKSNLSTLNQGELAFCEDTNEFYIGTKSGNLRIDASILPQDINNRFVTDAEKTAWNATITTDKIADKAITTDKIANGAITADKISADFKIGNMPKSVYDQNGNGIVDDSEKLGGKLPEYYAVKDNPIFTGGATAEKYLSSPWIQQGNRIEAYLGCITTTHNVSNEKASIIFGKIHMNGWLEIEVSATAWWQNSNGRLCRRFALSTNPDGGSVIASDYFTFADPSISYNFGISDLQWSPTVGWYIQLGKRLPQDGNQYHIFIRASGTDLPQQDLLYVSKIDTGDVTAFDAPVPQIPIDTVLRSGTTNYKIATLRKLNQDNTNTLIGNETSPVLDKGTGNTIVGYGSGFYLQNGISNTLIGEFAGFTITGNRNICIGDAAGYNIGNGIQNICISHSGELGVSNTIYIGNTIKNKCFITGIYGVTSTNGINVLINSSNQLGTTTSSKRYKRNIENIDQKYIDVFFNNARAIWYQSNTELCVNDNPDYGWWGFIAEELAEFDPRLVHFDYHEDDYEIVTKTHPAIRMIPNPEYQPISYENIYEDSPIDNDEDGNPIKILVGQKPIYSNTQQKINEEYLEEYYDKVLKIGANKSPRAVHYDRITVLLTKEVQRLREKEKQQDKIVQELIERVKKLEAK